MITAYDNQTLSPPTDRNSGRVFSDMVFRNCYFEGAGFSVADSPELRSTARNLQFIDCAVRGSSVDEGIIEDVVVENLKTYGLFQVWASAFKHVVLKGRIGRVMINTHVGEIRRVTGRWSAEAEGAFQRASDEYYRHVDWALDISQAEFQEFDLRGVPVHLVRRDPETQVIVTRERALQGGWRDVDISDTYWDAYIAELLRLEDPAVILAAPKRARNFRQLLEGLNRLREAGVAEPD